MCAEAIPWRCHRSLIADALILHVVRVEESINETRQQLHTLTPIAKVDGTAIIYLPYETVPELKSRRIDRLRFTDAVAVVSPPNRSSRFGVTLLSLCHHHRGNIRGIIDNH